MGEMGYASENLLCKHERKTLLGDLGMDGMITLKWIIEE
jgi:hypothetical protein